jgi:DNA-binding NarL/FixJ family response regulator
MLRTGTAGEEEVSRPHQSQPRFRVVVADDYDDVRLLVRIELEVSGLFEVVGEAANGQEAVSLVARHHPDVILLDLVMPVMNGLEAFPLIRRASPSTKVLGFTSFPVNLSDWRGLDVDGVIEKSAPVSELVEGVLRVVTQE